MFIKINIKVLKIIKVLKLFKHIKININQFLSVAILSQPSQQKISISPVVLFLTRETHFAW